MPITNHQFRLAARPVGLPKTSDWNYTQEPVRDPGPGEVLIKVLYLSLDPAMRGWMNEGKSYIEPVKIGDVMRAFGRAVVGLRRARREDEGRRGNVVRRDGRVKRREVGERDAGVCVGGELSRRCCCGAVGSGCPVRPVRAEDAPPIGGRLGCGLGRGGGRHCLPLDDEQVPAMRASRARQRFRRDRAQREGFDVENGRPSWVVGQNLS